MVQSRLPDAVRVVEVSASYDSVANAYAGWLLAQLGAHVSRFALTSPKTGESSDPVGAACSVLTNGKTTQPWPESAEELDACLATCDILLLDSAEALDPLERNLIRLRELFPRLVIGVATTFGLDGPYAGYPGGGLDAQALSGVAWALGDEKREPLSLPPGVVEHEGGVMLAAGALLALQVRDQFGSGRVVEIALTDVLASYVGGNSRLYVNHGLRWHRSGRRASGSGGAYPYVILPCRDGEVCVFGRTPQEWARLVKVMGTPSWAALPRYQDLRAMGQQYPEESDGLLRDWLAQHSKAELEAIALENNLILSPIREFDDVLNTHQFSARGFFQPEDIGGHDIMAPGLPFKVSEARGEAVVNIAPSLLRGASPADIPAAARVPSAPLAGLRVLDFGWVWSAPWVGTILAELGAEVIKVEHAKRPDNLRLSGRVIRDGKKVEGPSKEMSPMFHQVNHGKLGITLNVKEPRAIELLKRLAKKSDIVVENMSPGTIERAGLGYEELSSINPRIVMLSMSAAGQFGPLADMRAYAPNMSSAAGLESLIGYRGEPPIGSLNFALGDPNASAHALLAVLAALRRARLSGAGSYIDLSQIEALVSVLRPYLIHSQIAGCQSPTLGNAHPGIAPHGIFPASEDDQWLTITAATQLQWQALQGAIGLSWVRDARYATNDLRLENIEDLSRDLASWTVSFPRDSLVARLRDIGVASSPVLSIDEQWCDPHYAARKIKHTVTIPVYGEEMLFEAPWRFSDFAPRIDSCGPLTGQHNEQVLSELLGLSIDEIDELRAAGVVA